MGNGPAKFLAFLGLVIGRISGWSFEQYFIYSPMMYTPGAVFGAALAVIQWWFAEPMGRSLKRSALIVALCTACYGLALHLTCWGAKLLDLKPVYNGLFLVMLPTGFLSTKLMMMGLQKLTGAYSKRTLIWLPCLGAVMAALCIAWVSSTQDNNMMLFFMGWQTVMLIAVGLPLLTPGKARESLT